MSDWIPQQPGWFKLPPTQGMRVPGRIVATPSLLQQADLQMALQQVANVATLPGIVEASIAMPDIHWGYGFPIGGVAAFDLQEGVISPGGVGYDINCGVRLAIVPIAARSLSKEQRRNLLQAIAQRVGSGVGQAGPLKLDIASLDQVLQLGAEWALARSWAFPEDLAHCESLGHLPDADPQDVSAEAKQRGASQLGTIGSGNHFVELGIVAEIMRPEVATVWGIHPEQLYILIHTGSRGLGHQVCQDYLEKLAQQGYGEGLSDRQLMAAPLSSPEGQSYWRAMCAAANFAFCNRQLVLHHVREAVRETLKIPPEEVRLVYDVCHNIAKIEEHPVQGKLRKLCVHRKGATRAYGPGSSELSPLFRTTGQPVLVPGDMERASYVLAGRGHPLSWCSACHGAGRILSRHQMRSKYGQVDPILEMQRRGILVAASSRGTVVEEYPEAYKDVSEVVEAVELAGLADRVARLQPMMVLKG